MPITLNHSNINVQYETGKNYNIETVKSDLYVRNTNVDSVIRNNIQTAPVTPTTFVDSSGNVYAVESYTYSGTANTADYTRVFPKNTTCDILVVGGGGGGGKRHGGGGGAGTLMYHKNIIFNGTYNIKVGKGGAGHPTSITTTTSTALDGNFSQFIKSDGTQNYYAVGGGRGTGSLGPPNPPPHTYANTNGGQGFLYDSNITLSPNNIFNGVPVAVSNKQYVNTLPLPEGCRGNIGGKQINDAKGGGGGGAGSVGMDHGDETTDKDGYGGLGLSIDITGTSVVYAGGGNGTAWNSSVSQVFDPLYPTIQSRGGGGFGSDNGTPQNGLDGTGGGGGAQGSDTNGISSGSGGSGIVIIRYLLGTIPTTNFLTNEPTVSPQISSTEYIYPPYRYFTYNDSTGAYTVQNGSMQQGGSTAFTYNYTFDDTANTVGNNLQTTSTVKNIHGMGEYTFSIGGTQTADGRSSGVFIYGLANDYDISTSGNRPSVNQDDNAALPTGAGWYVGVGWSNSGTTYASANYYNSSMPGAWIKIAMPIEIVFTSFQILSWQTVRAPKDFKIYGSNTNTTTFGDWTLIHTETNHAYNTTTKLGPKVTVTNTLSFKNYLMVVSAKYSGFGSTDDTMSFMGWYIYGKEVLKGVLEGSLYKRLNFVIPNTYTLTFPVQTLVDVNNNSNIVLNGAYDISLSTSNSSIIPKDNQYIPKPTTFTNYSVERMYPPVRNFTAATTTVSGQTYGNGTYVVSFSATLGGGLDPWTCFNTSITSGGAWPEGRYTAGSFNSTSFIVSGYLGDWLKIQLPVAIKLTKFEFLMRNEGNQTLRDRSPKDFKIYGSNDNITWVELVNKTDAVYNASFKYEQTTPEITNTYTYYGLVVNKLFSSGTILNFDEWYIYGQEVLPGQLSLRYHLLNPILDPIGAQWTYSSNNTNVYHIGSVGIGTTSPEYQLDVRGTIFSSTGGYTQTGLTTWSIASDRRIKENIVKASYDKCLENVKNIELYNFNFKNNYVKTNDRRQLGFIAQEVQQVYPKAVEVSKMILNLEEKIDDLLTLNTTQIDYTLYGAVKGLIHKMENIKIKMEQIKGTSNITTQI